jgi:hypothetical protein
MEDIMGKYDEYNETLLPCRCGGNVVLTGGTYGYPTFGIKCLKCGGYWSMDTYSPEEAARKWGVKTTDRQRCLLYFDRLDIKY